MIFTKIAVIMALACAVVLADQPTTDNSDRCTGRTRCVKCTAATGTDRAGGGDACVWSTERQMCLHATTVQTTEAEEEEAMVYDPADCPRLDVIDEGRAAFDEPYAYRLAVSNDAVAGLVSHLGRAGFACLTSDGGWLRGRVELDGADGEAADGGVIACDPVAAPSSPDDGKPAMALRHYYIVFGPHNTTLRLDYETEYYVAFYDRDCSTVGDEGDGGYDVGCVDCAWFADDYKYYVKRCSTRNQCVGPFEYYDRRPVNGVHGNVTAWTNGTQTKCSRMITVEAFEPTEVPWTTTAVNVTVTVRNHRILAEGATVNVTVAGRACQDPRPSPADEDALTCTVSAAEPAEVSVVGPVRVTYAARAQLAVESAVAFRFVAPAITGLMGPACGPLGGGTVLVVRGTGFNASETARVFIQGPGGDVPCRVVKRTHDYIKCSTVARRTPTGPGRVRVDFDGALSLFVPGREFWYTHTPRPAAGQRLSGIASGGTSVTVRWEGLECVIEGSLVIFYVYPHQTRRMCWVQGDVLACQSPRLDDIANRLAEQDEAAKVRADKNGADKEQADGERADGAGLRTDQPVALLECAFGVRFAGDVVHQKCPEEGYAVYADPKFVDFEVTGDRVVVYGRGVLGLGFDDTDVVIKFRDRQVDDCEVVWMGRDRIECTTDAQTLAWLRDGPREVLVTVGHARMVVVPHRRPRDRDPLARGSRSAVGLDGDGWVAAAIASAAVVTLMAAIGYVAWLRYKKWTAVGRAATTRAVRFSDMPADGDDLTIFSTVS